MPYFHWTAGEIRCTFIPYQDAQLGYLVLTEQQDWLPIHSPSAPVLKEKKKINYLGYVIAVAEPF